MIRKVKKILVTILGVIIMFNSAACTPQGENNNDKKEKVTFIFQIDEGIAHNGLLGTHSYSRNVLEKALDNIFDGVRKLQKVYNVAFLIYPQWEYRESGYAQPASEPLNRISPALKIALNYIQENGYKFYLEMHSSGIYTSQNGESGSLPFVPLYYGEREKHPCLPMDLDVLRSIKTEYGDAFAGIRFHELIGSNSQGINGNPHAWIVEEDVLRAIIDVCRECKLKLVWSDHSWNKIYLNNDPKYDKFDRMLDYAVDTLGEKGVVMNWANNGWPMYDCIKGDFKYFQYRGTESGYSVQDWFWQETDASTMPKVDGTPKWYVDAHLDCPPEVMAAFTLRGLKNGFTFFQFESTQYFFNMSQPRVSGIYSPSVHEGEEDYSAKMTLKRFISYVLGETGYTPPDNLFSYYDENRELFEKYTMFDNGKRYYQTTLYLYDGNEVKAYDWYIDTPSKYFEQSENRITDRIMNQNVVSGARINFTYNANDEYLILKNINGRKELEFCNTRNGVYYTESTLFDDNENGEVVSVCGANVIVKYVGNMGVDSDEIIAVRKNGNNYSIEVYAFEDAGAAEEYGFTLQKTEMQLMNYLDFNKGDYIATIAVRDKFGNSVNRDFTRNTDGGILNVFVVEGGILLQGVYEGAYAEKTIALQDKVIAVTSADINLDFQDEIIVATKKGEKTTLNVFDYESGKKIKEIDIGNYDVKTMFSCKTGMYKKNWKI